MPRQKQLVPTVRVRRSSGQAYIRRAGRMIYLGAHGNEAAETRYKQLVHSITTVDSSPELMAAVASLPPLPRAARDLCRSELALQFLNWAATYDILDCQPMPQLDKYKQALRLLTAHFSRLRVAELDGPMLLFLQEQAIKRGWSRAYINQAISRLRRVLQWGQARKLVPDRGWREDRAGRPPVRSGQHFTSTRMRKTGVVL